ncbi:hypothetical protein [Furfurilactobacillus entadae]|uniref:hypothetical protein n=1 Tax=Furfurilactobacillus entadae TaxID=2922307 RepID=UPI0035EFAE2D
MYLKTYVETALNKLNSSKYENTAFSERLEVAAALLKGVPFEERSSRAPFFLNDLGVRFTESPREFAAWNSDKIDVTLPTSNEILDDLMKFNIDKLHYLLDAVVLITGDYDSVVQAVLQRKQEILSKGSYEALIYSGTAVASREKKGCL